MAAIMVGLLMFFIFISLRISTPEMKLLYADLSSADAGAVAAKLEENQIKYDVSKDGSRIVVPDGDVGRARLLLAEAGLPNGGSMGYEIFDEKSGFGTTNFVQNINQVRALEGELARTISAMSSIRSARVHLVLPQRELFSRENRAATASVFISVRPGSPLTREQTMAIKSLVAAAVPDLKPASVAIIDSDGNLLAPGNDDDVNLLSVKSEEMRLNYERRLADKIEDQISRVVGFGNVRATVNAEMNFDRISQNEELYDPEGQVVRSTQSTQESSQEKEPPSQDVSVQNNVPGINASLLNDQGPTAQSSQTEEITNFEISKTVRNTVREAGEIKRLSVAVLVDGQYTKDGEGNETYTPRPQEELDRISTLIKSAVGFSEERGDKVEVVNMQFAKVDTNEEALNETLLFGFEKNKLLDVAEIVTVAIMIVLVVLLVLQPMVNRLLVSEGPVEEDIAADLLSARPPSPALMSPDEQDLLPGPGSESPENMIDIQGVEGKVKASSMKKVEEIVQAYPQETVSVIRSWMSQEG